MTILTDRFGNGAQSLAIAVPNKSSILKGTLQAGTSSPVIELPTGTRFIGNASVTTKIIYFTYASGQNPPVPSVTPTTVIATSGFGSTEGAPLKIVTDLAIQRDDWRVRFICSEDVDDFCIECFSAR